MMRKKGKRRLSAGSGWASATMGRHLASSPGGGALQSTVAVFPSPL